MIRTILDKGRRVGIALDSKELTWEEILNYKTVTNTTMEYGVLVGKEKGSQDFCKVKKVGNERISELFFTVHVAAIPL